MEPIQYLKKEKEHVRRLKAMRADIYTKIAPVSVGVHPSREPIPPQDKEKLSYRPIHKNGIWGGVFGCAWFHMTAIVPASAAGKHVVLHTNVGGEGLVYDGVEPDSGITLIMTYLDRVQSGRGKSVIEIAQPAAGGESVDVYIDAGYNGYYNYPYGCGIFHYAELCAVDDELLVYYYDYLTVASLLSATTDPARRAELNRALDASYALCKRSIPQAADVLSPLLHGTPDPSGSFTAIGHSHLDLAWLWPLRETRRKAARTFANQLRNADRYPEYIYGASQPWQFEYIKNTYPAQYEKLLALHRRGQLELQGGMYVEADTNLSSGEALIRQIYYGKDFFRREFGREMEICWLPDVFGYSGNLPQLLRKSGLPYFMTIKLSWNEHNRFPYRSFVWSGIDGSEVLVHMPPDENYNSAGSPACMRHALDNYTEREAAPEALMVYGVGDGGGGPGEAHIEMLKRQSSLDGSPRVTFGKAIDFFRRFADKRDALPRYRGELYLEKHQGTYTTQAWNKKYNRRCEYALQDLEALCALAHTRGRDYPQADLDRWWKEVLLYQFHDILPGSCVTRVYVESRARYAAILAEVTAARDEVLAFLSGQSQDSGKATHVYNPTSFERREFLQSENGWHLAGVKPYGFAPLASAKIIPPEFGDNYIENDRLRVSFGRDGEIVSAVTKADGREYADSALNVLRLYRDKFLFFNAWDIDWKYFEKPSTILKAYNQETILDGARVVRRNYYRHGSTKITQDVSLLPGSDVICFETACDWHETFRMLRADFDVAVRAKQVRCDIQMGSILRSTGDETDLEKAQFEICAHKYVDLSDGEKGVSLLNDCKYGHRVKGNRISLNLLRSPVVPDKTADRMKHTFTYALKLHDGGCGVETLRDGYFLNKPLVLCGDAGCESIAASSNPTVVVETIKKAYADDAIVIRLYESQGADAVTALATAFSTARAVETDLVEENELGAVDLDALTFTPFEIKTVKLYLR